MEPITVRVLLVGDSGVGKSSLITRFTENKFEDQPPDFDSKDRMITVKSREVCLRVMDTAGQERFRTLTSGSYRGVEGVLICYSVTDDTSFKNVPQWLQEVTKYALNPNLAKVLVANKIDLASERVITADEGSTYGSSNGMQFFEVSAKDNTGVAEAFQWIAGEVLRRTGNDDAGAAEGSDKKCCVLL